MGRLDMFLGFFGFKDTGNPSLSADSPLAQAFARLRAELVRGALTAQHTCRRARPIGVYPPGRVPPAEREHVASSEHQRAALPRPSYDQLPNGARIAHP